MTQGMRNFRRLDVWQRSHYLALEVNRLAAFGGGVLVIDVVPIAAALCGTRLPVVGATGEVVRLHELMVTMLGQGTIAVSYDTDGAGTGAVALSGAFPLGAGGGIPIAWRKDPDGALTTLADKHLTVTFGTTGGAGYAIISKGPA